MIQDSFEDMLERQNSETKVDNKTTQDNSDQGEEEDDFM